MTIALLVSVLVGTIGAGTAYYLAQDNKKLRSKVKTNKASKLSEEETLARSSEKAKSILLKAENNALEIQTKTEQKIRKMYTKLEDKEKILLRQTNQITFRSKNLNRQAKTNITKTRVLEQTKKDLKKMRDKLTINLENIANLTHEEAKKQLMDSLETDLQDQMAKRIKSVELETQREADDRAKWILVDAMQESATDYVAETTTTTLDLESEDIKGKIIGKEGRNIRTFEKLTGVDIIVDEAPEAVTLSCFDPVRREVAAITLQKLLKDGRVHPGTIETTVQKVKEEIGREIRKTGEKLAYDTGFSNLPIEVIRLLGRFKYRYSYGQNLIKHTLEMVKLGSALAAELDADIDLTKKACLLHDIGKVVMHKIEGKPHHIISGEIIREYLHDEKLANAAEAHHGDIEAKSIEAVIVRIADAISGSRPGARRDNYENYLKRIRTLEDIAQQYKEVKEAYAIRAGREIRIILRPTKSNDKDAEIIAHKVAKEIEKVRQYPGNVKVIVLREFRAEAEAK